MTADQGESLMSGVAPETPSEPDYLAEFVGEGKKYTTIEDAAKALAKKAVHADQFIETIKREKQEIESKLAEAEARTKTADEIVELITTKAFYPGDGQQQAMNQDMTAQQTTPSGLKPEEVEALVEAKLRDRALALERRAQKEKTWGLLVQEFGSDDAVKQRLLDYAGDNPVRREAVDKLGFTDPAGLVLLLKSATSEKEQFSPDRSREHTGDPTVKTGLTWSKAKELKRTDPRKYNSLAFQRELQQAASSDPNFYKK